MADNTPDGWLPQHIPDHEVWVQIDTNPTYEVSSYGRVRTKPRTVFVFSPTGNHFKRFKALIKTQQTGGRTRAYRRVTLSHPSRFAYVHHLVASAFIGPRPEGCDVLHGDDNGSNNKLVNIRYGDKDENVLDRYINSISYKYADAPF